MTWLDACDAALPDGSVVEAVAGETFLAFNTKYGTMKNKRYLPTGKVPLSAWKAVIDAGIAGRNRILAVTPKSIKKAMTDELTYFAHLKANHYSLKTPLAPFTVAEVKQLANFQRTKCGITFGA